MPKFSGDVREYAIFRSDFKHAFEARYSKWDAHSFTPCHHTIHHVNVTAGSRSKTKSGSNRCWICKTQAHCTDECQRFMVLNPEERINIVQENHACFSCLKRAGRDHKLITCNRRKRCTETENGIQCRQYHQPFLHKRHVTNIRASISSMRKQKLYFLLSQQASVVEMVYITTQTSFSIQEHN